MRVRGYNKDIKRKEKEINIKEVDSTETVKLV